MAIARRKRLRRISKSRRHDVTRGEFNALVDELNQRSQIIEGTNEELRHALDVQFRRIAQIQLELDQIRLAWMRRKKSDTSA